MDKLSFRITSSKWLENYKSAQTFALHQSMNAEIPFQTVTQEVLIDLYDSWFVWISEVEAQLSTKQVFSQEDRRELLKSAIAQQAQLYREWGSNTLLDTKLVTLWVRAYKPVVESFVAFIRKTETVCVLECFGTIAEKLLGFLQHCLFTLHEIDQLLYNPKISGFISVDDYGCDVYNQQGRDLLGERLRLYSNENDQLVRSDDAIDWAIKQYAESQLPSGLLNQIEINMPKLHGSKL
jgi:hypothetical protein